MKRPVSSKSPIPVGRRSSPIRPNLSKTITTSNAPIEPFKSKQKESVSIKNFNHSKMIQLAEQSLSVPRPVVLKLLYACALALYDKVKASFEDEKAF